MRGTILFSFEGCPYELTHTSTNCSKASYPCETRKFTMTYFVACFPRETRKCIKKIKILFCVLTSKIKSDHHPSTGLTVGSILFSLLRTCGGFLRKKRKGYVVKNDYFYTLLFPFFFCFGTTLFPPLDVGKLET